MISSLGALYCLLDTEETPAARARAAQVLSPNRAPLVTSPIEDKEARERCFTNFAPLSPDVPDAPQPPDPAVTTDIAGRRRFAQIVRKAGTLLDPDPERFNNRVFREGRYRTYPRTPGEENLNPDLRKHEEKFYLARGGGPSQISLVPGTPNVQASGSGSQTPRPDTMPHHGRSDSGGSQLLGVPQTIHRSLNPSLTVSTSQPAGLLFSSDSSTPQITISPDSFP